MCFGLELLLAKPELAANGQSHKLLDESEINQTDMMCTFTEGLNTVEPAQ